MAKTLAIHFAVVTARSRQALFDLTFLALQVLHCDIHLGLHLGSVTIRPHRSVLTLIGSDDNALSCGKTARHIVALGWDLRKTMSVDRQRRAVALGALALSALALGCPLAGCSSPIADMPSLGSADTSAKPRDPYLPVHDLPPDRDEAAIAPDQRAKIEAELAAARDRQTQASAAQNAGAQTSAAQNPGTK